MDAWLAPVTALVASFGGYALAGFNDSRRDSRTAIREREARAVDEKRHRDEARHRVQLDALTALQVDVQTLARSGGRVLHFDHMQARLSEYTQTPTEWDESDLAVRQSLARNVSRVLDDEVRQSVEDFAAVVAEVTLSPQDYQGLAGDFLEEAAARKMHRLTAAYEDASVIIGVCLRREIAWEPAGDDA